ncbi:Golgi-specific brefeldin A-resistance guanine nucleotide exchange factor 1 [Fasciola gigantica]|uniref:Golgi-specific brefeldin A-resistance guanine nucleotide exchange factor 1 n=1 Tax=Fasciola gigantica TaxID=46835 RepID=A0A504YLE1_FASGI|nr:Golgi-specific brefeldin A-resistance guanine nucleotide exchange factor 1 [Fasciola gigantica]
MAPSNALCIVQSEISLLSTALRCHTRIVFRGHQDELRSPLYKSFLQLKSILNGVSSLNEIEPLVYLTPFLEVIRSEDTTGPITGLALTAVDKFLSYGLLELPDPDYADASLSGPGSRKSVAMAAEAIADSGTQARFVGTERSSDEVVLMKVLHLLRTLLLVPAGSLVSDRVVREILQSCFRICFEPKLSELLRRTAELCLASIIQLFFSRLPSLIATSLYQQQIETGMKFGESSSAIDESSVHTTVETNTVCTLSWQSDHTGVAVDQEPKTATVEAKPHPGPVPLNSLCTTSVLNGHLSTEDLSDEITALSPEPNPSTPSCHTQETALDDGSDKQGPSNDETCLRSSIKLFLKFRSPTIVFVHLEKLIFTTIDDFNGGLKIIESVTALDTSIAQPRPYGLPAVHDLLHYLISLLTPERNADGIISVSLGLVTIALETGADAISNCPSLLQLVQGDLTKHLLLLLYSDRVWQFAATLRVCFMLFESMRKHLKLQMEVYLQRLTAICSPDNESTSYERREVALDSVVRLFLVPGLATELYVNYDCDPYCSNLFEDIAKMLAKNAYPVDRLMGTHLLALDALLAVLNTIGTQCVTMTPSGTRESSDLNNSRGTTDALRHVRTRLNRHPTDKSRLPSREQLTAAKETKKILILGSEQFNSKPKRGIEFLQHYRVLHSPLDPTELAHFLRENPRLDKRMIGEYLSDRKNGEVLGAYVRQFNFKGVQIDEALRVYLEAFRLPGEAPLIQRIMEHFAEHWYYANNEPFADVDSAFTLAYAILMLNTDQHNPNSKKQNAPMTASDFRKNLSGMNGTGDFDPKLLDAIYRNIHKNEIVMPSEQTGLVRENYLWKCLLRRAATNQADFIHVQTGALDPELFDIIWGPTVSALSFIFDKTLDPAVQIKAVDGFIRCAAIAAHHGMSDVLDNLVISLCKFTTLLTLGENPSTLSVSLGRNNKALLALRLVFALSANHADILRYGWHSLLDCLLQLFRASLLPDELVEAEDFVSPSRRVRLTTRGCAPVIDAKSRGGKGRGNAAGGSNREVSVFSSFYQYLTTGSAWTGSNDEDDADEEDLHDQYYEQSRQPQCSSANRGVPDSVGASVEWPGRRLEQFSASYWASIGSAATSGSQLDDASATRVAVDTVAQCAIAQLIKDTKFLVDASLIELIKVNPII